MRSIGLAVIFCLLAAGVLAADFSALVGTQLNPACRESRCQHLTLRKVEQVGASDGGAGKLFVVVIEDATSGPNGAQISKGDPANVAFVFCSRTRPTVFYPSTDGSPTWSTADLHPNTGDDISDATEASYMVYFASCHRTAVAGAEEIGALARRLGYRVKPAEGMHERTVNSPFAAILQKETQ